MKTALLTFFLLTACTFSKNTLEQGPLYKVGDSFGTDPGFYLGQGTMKVTAVFYGACRVSEPKQQWIYYAVMKRQDGSVIDDVEVCEKDLGNVN